MSARRAQVREGLPQAGQNCVARRNERPPHPVQALHC
ncbi:hypothetical protein A2U01_0113696 [Trifolium medium]|uniref:Uncharacterized protein n=1 Tax=Trifolium medium TaxID=97028 RepID=A0A392W138_9FABA|nr:hypothetical protein [Trifolium medium]